MIRILITGLLFSWSLFSSSPQDVVKNYLKNIKIGTPQEFRNLKIYPILAKKVLSLQDYITLDQAQDMGYLKIREAGSGEVNFVEIKNNGKKMVFVMTGEIIKGARQDRMLKEDILIPANSGWLRVPVFCVEHGRWTETTPEFKSDRLLVPNEVRKTAKMTERQVDVWDEIASSQAELGIAPGTGTVRANYEDEKTKKELDDYAREFGKFPKMSEAMIGIVVVSGNRVIGLDLFANNDLLGQYWDKLIKAYAMDALSGAKASVDKDDIENLIESLNGCQFTSTGTSGLGSLCKTENELGKGSVLVYKSAVIHLDFFMSHEIDDDDLRIDLRRNERLTD